MTIREFFEREAGPSVPPWLSVRFWFSVLAVVLSVIALVMSA